MTPWKVVLTSYLIVIVLFVLLYSINRTTSTIQKDIATLGAQGNKVADMADQFLEERNECRVKLRMCEGAKMEMFSMYNSCEEDLGRFLKKR